MPVHSELAFFSSLQKISKRENAAGHAKKYILGHTNTTASAPSGDRYHRLLVTLITLGKADEGENYGGLLRGGCRNGLT